MLITVRNLKNQIKSVNQKGIKNLALKGVNVSENATIDDVMNNIMSIEGKNEDYISVKSINDQKVKTVLRSGEEKNIVLTKENDMVTCVSFTESGENVPITYENGKLVGVGSTQVNLGAFNCDDADEVTLFEQSVDFQYDEAVGAVYAICDASVMDLKTENAYVKINGETHNAFIFKNDYSDVMEIGFENSELNMLIGYLGDRVAIVSNKLSGVTDLKIYRIKGETDYEIFVTAYENEYYVNTVLSFFKDFQAGRMSVSYSVNGTVKKTSNITLKQENGKVYYSGRVLKDASEYIDNGDEVEINFLQTRSDGKTVSLSVSGQWEMLVSGMVGYKVHNRRKLCNEEGNSV